LGHFALTAQLIGGGMLAKKINGKAGSRIINVSSTAHLLGTMIIVIIIIVIIIIIIIISMIIITMIIIIIIIIR
jgi:hypothetical protein